MDIDVRLRWTPTEWRRFLGLADITPLVELASVMIDQVVLGIVHQRLEALTPVCQGTEAEVSASGKAGGSRGSSGKERGGSGDDKP